MKISYNWLKSYLKTDVPLETLAVILTDIGLELEHLQKIETVRGGLEGVVVGEVLTCEKHPDADKLSLTTVSVGAGEPLQIVCGAPNVAAGLKVLVATVGTTLYPKGEAEGFKIKRSKIRGVESLGMLCAADELGLGDDHDGIMVLDGGAAAGTPAAELLKLQDDYLIEIGLTPNRVDAASHYGVARDVAAYLKVNNLTCELELPSVEGFAIGTAGREVKVEVENSAAAPRYAGVTITGVTVAPSPEWLQQSLRAIGINPKNNIVDITNFVLHELGQPLHAFDADQITGDRIVVRTCPEGTKFTTLDGVERTLSASDLMICDSEKPMCIAGVFGGAGSGVSELTTAIFIESAYFDPIWVRKTAKRHGLNTDASFRYERGIDPQTAVYALKRAAMLVVELAGGVISSPITDIYPTAIEPFRFNISYSSINRMVGKEIPEQTVDAILKALEVEVEKAEGGVMSVVVPAYRVDVQREVDLIEDILRIYGYNNVEIPAQMRSSLSYAARPDRTKLINTVSDFLSASGFTEIMSNSLTKATYYDGLTSYPASNCVRIANPLSIDLNAMRQTLLFNALEAVQLNANRKHGDLKIYEFGNCYYYNPEKKEEGGLAPYSETMKLAIAITGANNAPLWSTKVEQTNFFTLKAMAEKILARFGLNIYNLRCETLRSDLFGEAVSLSLPGGGKELIQMGVVSKAIRQRFDLKGGDIFFMELNFDLLVHTTRKHRVQVAELSKYPEVKRDLALLVDVGVTFSELRDVAFGVEKKLLKNVSLFDVYQGDKVPEGKKSYALSFVLQDSTRTLTDEVIDRSISNLASAFESKLGATVPKAVSK